MSNPFEMSPELDIEPHSPQDLAQKIKELRGLEKTGTVGHQALSCWSDTTRFLGLGDFPPKWFEQKLGSTDKEHTTHEQMDQIGELVNEALRSEGKPEISVESHTDYNIDQLERLRQDGARIIVNWMTGTVVEHHGHYSIFDGLCVIGGNEYVVINDSEWTSSIRFIRRDVFESDKVWFDNINNQRVEHWCQVISEEDPETPSAEPIDQNTLPDYTGELPEVIIGRKARGFCGPACLAHLALSLGYPEYDQDRFVSELKISAHDLEHNPTFGTTHAQLLEGLSLVGNVEEVEESLSHHVDLDDLEDRRTQGAKILVNWMSGDITDEDGHYSIFEGFIMVDGIEYVKINDPEWVGAIRLIPRDEFEDKWFDVDTSLGERYNRYAIIVTKK